MRYVRYNKVILWWVAEIFAIVAGCRDLPELEPFHPFLEVSIMPDEQGYLEAEKNEVALQGRWYAYASKRSEIHPEPLSRVTRTSDGMCASGKVSKVILSDNTSGDPYEVYYGAGIGFHICYSDDDDSPPEFPYTMSECPLSSGLHKRLAGVAFDIAIKETGTATPEIRVMFDEWRREQDAYYRVDVSGAHRALISKTGVDYNSDYDFPADPTEVIAILFQAVSIQGADLEFDFCISNLRALLYSDPGTEGGAPSIWKGDTPDSGDRCDPENYEDAGLEWEPVSGETFSVLKTEVTARQYDICKKAGCCAPTGDWEICNVDNVQEELREDGPANCVTWHDADNFCRWAEGRLPSESEWELAARGGQGPNDIAYPWGDRTPSCDLAIMDDADHGCGPQLRPADVCSRSEASFTANGACDMAGNVWEWVDDWYPEGETAGIPSETFRIIKGGSYNSRKNALETTARGMAHPLLPRDFGRVGFRCVK